jgi:N-acetyl-gamma-glutamyl-phosphate reductase
MVNVLVVGKRGPIAQRMRMVLYQDARYNVNTVDTGFALATDAIDNDVVILCGQESSSSLILPKISARSHVIDVGPVFRCHPNWDYGNFRAGVQELPGKRVAVPGCFATAAILAIEPLVSSYVLPNDINLCLRATGGYTVGGHRLVEKANQGILYMCDVVMNLDTLHHHVAEIKQATGLVGNVSLIPNIREHPSGVMIVTTFEETGSLSRDTIEQLYRRVYANRSDICVHEQKTMSQIRSDAYMDREGAGISVHSDGSFIHVVSWLDNLRMGSVSTAKQLIDGIFHESVE